jgi:hypothetical protein
MDGSPSIPPRLFSNCGQFPTLGEVRQGPLWFCPLWFCVECARTKIWVHGYGHGYDMLVHGRFCGA